MPNPVNATKKCLVKNIPTREIIGAHNFTFKKNILAAIAITRKNAGVIKRLCGIICVQCTYLQKLFQHIVPSTACLLFSIIFYALIQMSTQSVHCILRKSAMV